MKCLTIHVNSTPNDSPRFPFDNATACRMNVVHFLIVGWIHLLCVKPPEKGPNEVMVEGTQSMCLFVCLKLGGNSTSRDGTQKKERKENEKMFWIESESPDGFFLGLNIVQHEPRNSKCCIHTDLKKKKEKGSTSISHSDSALGELVPGREHHIAFFIEDGNIVHSIWRHSHVFHIFYETGAVFVSTL